LSARGSILGSPRLVLAARIVLGAIFIVACADKLAHPGLFADAINNYRILPLVLVNPAAVVLPWLELLVGLGLLFGRADRGAALLALALMSGFTAALGFNLARGLDISCGCFTVAARTDPATLLTLARDVLFIVLSLTVFGGLKRQRPPTWGTVREGDIK
jgi:uncharacterized membrane protein YphA (DoxX/SURF4 family)